MSDTPRTDREQDLCNIPLDSSACVSADFARTLERELAEAKAENATFRLKADADFEVLYTIRMKLTEAGGDPFKLHNEMLDDVIARMKKAESDNAALLKDYEEALAERNKAWRKADEIESDNASRITREQYREHEMKKLTDDNAALRAEINRVQDERAASFARLGKAVGGISLTEYQPEVDLEIEAAIKELRADKERLDWLDEANQALNEMHGTQYGWKYDANHNRCQIAITDCNIPALSIRQAIDAARAALAKKN
jgi:hypothetical protein